ncbi:MAG: cold shock domain-containing protein [Chitinispirillales bacterium]|jgi:cold shock CspA family protein|nr:cold shock domain-containing protein [Chitinispirillales bacterium]
MQKPLEVTFRDVPHYEEARELIESRAEKLDEICDHIISCNVMVERGQKHRSSAQPYKVRIGLRMPPGHEIVVSRDPNKADLHLDLEAEIRWAFDAAERQIKELMEKQRRDVKKHPFSEADGIVEKIFRNDGVGFIRTFDDRQVFFHRHALVNDNFDTLREGAAVRFVETMGEKGPQASTVQVVEAPPKY